MLITAVVLGILVSVQWSVASGRSTASADQLDSIIRQLELEQQELKKTVGRLRERLDTHPDQRTANADMLQGLRAELLSQKALAGLLEVRGAGVQVILDDSERFQLGNEEDLLIHDYDLRDVINLLWMAGAEAVAVNEERVVGTTSLYCVGSTILVNDTRLSPPYHVKAIGDSVRLQDHLRNPGYLRELKARSARYGVQIESVPVGMMTLPAYQGSLPYRFAQPGS
jgi:uncharacterized protein YlxW (UPF0749 family)